MDAIKSKFIAGDTVYVLTTKRIGVNLEIVKKIFLSYENCDRRVSLRDLSQSHNTINLIEADQVFKSIEDATIYGIIYFITIKEPNIIINNNMDFFDQYYKIEKEHPDLILKYIDYIMVT